VIPGRVTMDLDIRDSDSAARERVVGTIIAKLHELADRRGLSVEIETITRDEPAACSPLVIEAVTEACATLGVSAIDMISGAYHDAMVLGAKVPIGMIFVPSRDGLSHHPDEYTAPEEIDRGVAVLAGTLARLSG
jgi:acetylornithine deacetylase/succinyl-diaminopimelate desuccinylase-like protein